MTTLPKTKKSLQLYADEKAIAFLSESPCAKGHTEVYPKESTLSLTDLDEETFLHLVSVASYASSALFESLGLQGTNIIIQSGRSPDQVHDRVCFQVIPRSFEDGISFQWKPKSLSEEEMIQTKDSLSHHMLPLPKNPDKKEVKKSEQEKKDIKKDTHVIGKNNYLFASLKKIP